MQTVTMETTTARKISPSVLAMYFQVLAVQSFIPWQEKKLSMIKIIQIFVSDHLIEKK